VRIYHFNGSAWIQRGLDIDGEAADDLSGFSVALSSDGQTVAIGAIGNDGTDSEAGHVRVMRLANFAASISGTPPTSVFSGAAYNFAPFAADADGDAITFSIANKPAWAAFNTQTGTLSGTPGASDSGKTTSGIVISAIEEEGLVTALPPFDLVVIAAGVPSAPRITNTDYDDGAIYLTVSVADGGSPISQYTATCSDGSNTVTGSSPRSLINVTGLTNGAAYTCTVSATNIAGTGPVSSPSKPITPEEQVQGSLPIWLLKAAME
jgi:hypothetical protein